MSKLYLFGGITAIVLIVGWYFIQVIQESERRKIALDAAAHTINVQAQDATRKSQVNQDRDRELEGLHNEASRLRSDLAKLRRTQIQRDCDAVPLPDGYLERLQQYYTQTRLSETRPGLGSAKDIDN